MILRRITEHVKAQNWFSVRRHPVRIAARSVALLTRDTWIKLRDQFCEQTYFLDPGSAKQHFVLHRVRGDGFFDERSA